VGRERFNFSFGFSFVVFFAVPFHHVHAALRGLSPSADERPKDDW
jgi:hypothetical protein